MPLHPQSATSRTESFPSIRVRHLIRGFAVRHTDWQDPSPFRRVICPARACRQFWIEFGIGVRYDFLGWCGIGESEDCIGNMRREMFYETRWSQQISLYYYKCSLLVIVIYIRSRPAPGTQCRQHSSGMGYLTASV